MDITELTALVTKVITSYRWECEDCKRKGLWFTEGTKQTTTNNGERHSERFGHTTYMTTRSAGFAQDGSGYLQTEPVRL